MVRDDGDSHAAAVGGVVRAAGLCGAHRLTVRGGARSRQGKAVRLPVLPRAGRSTYRSGQFGKYTGSRIQRVWLQRTPGYYEQFFFASTFLTAMSKKFGYNDHPLITSSFFCIFYSLKARSSVRLVAPCLDVRSFRNPKYSKLGPVYNEFGYHERILTPATKLRQDNVFTPVCHSVHRGRGSLSQHAPQVTWPRGVSVWGGVLCPGGSLSGGVCPEGVSRGPGGLCPEGVSVRGVSVRETPRTVTSGWYASYWNAFLFLGK